MAGFTRKAIKQSFWKLLNERPLNQITVKDIVEDCGINRNSFYYHFQDMPSLIEEIVQDVLGEIREAHPAVENPEDGITMVLNFVLKHRRAVYHIYNSVDHAILEKHLLDICDYVVRDCFKDMENKIPGKEQELELLIRYHKCECFGQIIQWLNNGMKDDILNGVHSFCIFSQKITREFLMEEEN